MVDSPTVPRSKSVLKRQRQTEGRSLRNKSARSALRTSERKLRTAADGEAARTALKTMQRDLDRAAAGGAIHPNKAARKKSRLAKAAAKKSS
jgi:small subunit ribosomal protein S20